MIAGRTKIIFGKIVCRGRHEKDFRLLAAVRPGFDLAAATITRDCGRHDPLLPFHAVRAVRASCPRVRDYRAVCQESVSLNIRSVIFKGR